MKKRKAEAQLTKQSILSAALSVFSQKGYAATKMEDIAREAGVSRGAVYWHYSNKSDLYSSLIDASTLKINALYDEICGMDNPPIVKIHDMLFGYLMLLADDSEMKSQETLSLFYSGIAEEKSDFSAIEAEYVDVMRSHVEEFVREGVAEGQIRSDIDPRILTTSLFCYYNGIAESWVRNPERFSLMEYTPNLVRIILDGIKKR